MATTVENGDHEGEAMKGDGQPPSSSAEQTEWDEKRIETADKVLKDMYIKVNHLVNS